MKMLKLTITISLLLVWCSVVYSLDKTVTTEATGAPPEKTRAVKDDNRLPIYKEGWQFIVAPYFWMIGVHLNNGVTKGGFSSSTVANIPWSDLVPLYFSKVIGAMGRVEVWKDRWGFFIDNIFIYVGDTVSAGGSSTITSDKLPVPVRLLPSGQMKIIVRQGTLGVGGRYLLGSLPLSSEKPLPVLSAELLGGVRYNWYNQSTSLDLNATLTGPSGQEQITPGGSFNSSLVASVVEPFVGLRLGFWFTGKVNLLLRADVGGFGFVAYNHVDTNLEALLGYQFHKNMRAYAGYRGRYYSLAKGSGSDEFKSHGWYHGPVLGVAFNF